MSKMWLATLALFGGGSPLLGSPWRLLAAIAL